MKTTPKRATQTTPPRHPHHGSIDPGKVLAHQVMRPDVMTLRMDDTIEAAIALFEECHVSGAPVVDASGRLCGVLSMSDVAQRGRLRGEGQAMDRLEARRGDVGDDPEAGEFESECFSREDYSPEVLGAARVAEWMTDGLVAVQPGATLAEVCQRMLEESIHRVFVVENGSLRGVVSTYDLVRLLAGGTKLESHDAKV